MFTIYKFVKLAILDDIKPKIVCLEPLIKPGNANRGGGSIFEIHPSPKNF